MRYRSKQALNNFMLIFNTRLKNNKHSIVKGILVYLMCILPWVAVWIWAFLKTGIFKQCYE